MRPELHTHFAQTRAILTRSRTTTTQTPMPNHAAQRSTVAAWAESHSQGPISVWVTMGRGTAADLSVTGVTSGLQLDAMVPP